MRAVIAYSRSFCILILFLDSFNGMDSMMQGADEKAAVNRDEKAEGRREGGVLFWRFFELVPQQLLKFA